MTDTRMSTQRGPLRNALEWAAWAFGWCVYYVHALAEWIQAFVSLRRLEEENRHLRHRLNNTEARLHFLDRRSA